MVEIKAHSSWVNAVAMSPCSKFVASAGNDRCVRVWDTVTGERVMELRGHDGCGLCTCHMHMGSRTMVHSPCRVVGHAAGVHCHSLVGSHLSGGLVLNFRLLLQVLDVTFSPCGQMLATGGYDPAAIVWDVNSGQVLRRLEGQSRSVTCLAWSPHGDLLATGSWDRLITLWDVSMNRKSAKVLVLVGHVDWVYSVHFAPDGRTLSSGCQTHMRKEVMTSQLMLLRIMTYEIL